jgi:hypothetical protein
VLETLKNLQTYLGDGLLGMGFASLAKGQLTLIDNLFNEKQIPEKVAFLRHGLEILHLPHCAR